MHKTTKFTLVYLKMILSVNFFPASKIHEKYPLYKSLSKLFDLNILSTQGRPFKTLAWVDSFIICIKEDLTRNYLFNSPIRVTCIKIRGRRGRDPIVVRFTTTYAVCAYHH